MARLDLTPAGFDQSTSDFLATTAVYLETLDEAALAEVLEGALAVRDNPTESNPRRLAASLIVLAARGRKQGATAADNLAMFRRFATEAGLINERQGEVA